MLDKHLSNLATLQLSYSLKNLCTGPTKPNQAMMAVEVFFFFLPRANAAGVTTPSAPGQEKVSRLWGCLRRNPGDYVLGVVCNAAVGTSVFTLPCIVLCHVVKMFAPWEKFVNR